MLGIRGSDCSNKGNRPLSANQYQGRSTSAIAVPGQREFSERNTIWPGFRVFPICQSEHNLDNKETYYQISSSRIIQSRWDEGFHVSNSRIRAIFDSCASRLFYDSSPHFRKQSKSPGAVSPGDFAAPERPGAGAQYFVPDSLRQIRQHGSTKSAHGPTTVGGSSSKGRSDIHRFSLFTAGGSARFQNSLRGWLELAKNRLLSVSLPPYPVNRDCGTARG